MQKKLYLYRRNGGVFYVQFRDPITGRRTTPQSTRTKNKAEATEIAYEWLHTKQCTSKVKAQSIVAFLEEAIKSNSISTQQLLHIQSLVGLGAIPLSTTLENVQDSQATEKDAEKEPEKVYLLQWLKEFWTYETSEYVCDKLSHGMRISKRHCYDQLGLLKNWESFFDKKKRLEDLSIDDLQAFEKFLYEKTSYKKRTVVDETTGKKSVEIYPSKLSNTTRNKIIKVGKTAFEWAVRRKILTENPCKGLTPYHIEAKERGILTRKEASKLFTVGTWKDDRARIASLVAMTTGLRISEILALQSDDIGDDRLFITRSWTTDDGFKTTKNGESRVVPLVPSVKAELLKLSLQNPHREKGDKFIFFGNLTNKPVVSNVITEDYRLALESIGITEDQRQRRNIVFHSWRHFYATTIATELSEKHAQLTLGHLTAAMTKHYSDHKTEEALLSVCSSSNKIFAQMLHA